MYESAVNPTNGFLVPGLLILSLLWLMHEMSPCSKNIRLKAKFICIRSWLNAASLTKIESVGLDLFSTIQFRLLH